MMTGLRGLWSASSPVPLPGMAHVANTFLRHSVADLELAGSLGLDVVELDMID